MEEGCDSSIDLLFIGKKAKHLKDIKKPVELRSPFSIFGASFRGNI
jgi:hypothetical protein